MASTTYSPNGTNLTINQASQTAILNWQNFNIDKGYSVNFVQPSSTSSALNRIWDANPTTIAGSLTANGQLYLINQNGIIFANGAQVNTGALIASSLDITDSLYTAGYLTNTQVIPAFSGIGGFVRVDSGAVLNGSRIMLFAPVVENNGTINTPDGQTVMAAGNKVYLEASQDPNLRGVLVEVDVTNPGAVDANLIGKVQNNASGTVTNTADIIAQRGNITLIGYAVNQQGRVSATTSVTENGSIKLLARYNVASQLAVTTSPSQTTFDIRATQTGKVTLASGSVTQILPELADTSTTTDGQGFKQSIVEVMGNTINMQSGSSIIAPGGQVTLAAMGSISPSSGLIGSVYQDIASANAFSSFLNPAYRPITGDSSQVFLDSGSLIDVSGSQASVSVARDILTVQLRGSQLADAPLQRNGFLWGQNVLIDIRQGSTLANYAGEEAQIGRAVAERTSTGGSVNLIAGGNVVMKRGAEVNLSGGQVDYTGAFVQSTSLISTNGTVYNIANAPGNVFYNGISGSYSVTNNKWGITETYNTMAGGDTRGRWDPGYVQGMSAGTLTVLAPAAVMNGDIVANTVAGINQRQPYVNPNTLATNSYKNTWQMLPQGGSLVIGDSTAKPDSYTNIANYITNSNVIIQNGAPQLASSFTLFDPLTGNVNALPTNLQQNIYLDSSLFSTSGGISHIEIDTNQAITVAAGSNIQLAPGGTFTLKGNSVNMQGNIDIPAGIVNLVSALTTGSTIAGALTVGAAGSPVQIITRGQWVNDAFQTGIPDLSKPLLINGGSINLSSGSDLLVAAGTLLDASGGAWMDTGKTLHGGNGGAITLASGKTPANALNAFQAQVANLDLRSYGTAGGKGGILTLKAADIVLGTSADIVVGSTIAANNTCSSINSCLVLSPVFFQSGGFSSYNLSAQGLIGFNLAAGTAIDPLTQSLIVDRSAYTQSSGTDVTTFAQPGLLPDWQRAPASISLSASNLLKVDLGAVVKVDPTASIKLSAGNQLTVLGTLDAPAGIINLSLTGTNPNYMPTSSIWLGSQSELLSQGDFLQTQPTSKNLTQGQVLNGGQINISSGNGFVVAQKGSLLDVSGSSANVDLPQLSSGILTYQRNHVSGGAGSISIQTSEGGFLDGTMNATVESGSQAAAGLFTLILNNNPVVLDSTNLGGYPLNPAQIQIMNGGNGGFAALVSLTPGDDTNAGQTTLTGVAGSFVLDANALNNSGFDQVKLKSGLSIVLADQVNLQTRRSITLDAPQLISNGSSIVSSAQIIMGNLDSTNQAKLMLGPLNPGSGSGSLNIVGQMVDLTGNFMVSGVNQFNVYSSGDIRFNGVLDPRTQINKAYTSNSLTGSLITQGDLTLTADQVYASTMAQFSLSVVNSAGSTAGNITIKPGPSGASPVMSAGSRLTLNAANITQNGVLKAPLGTLTLNGTQNVTLGTGSLTSVSMEGLIVPFGQIQGGTSWFYDLTGAGSMVSVSAPPQKIVNLTAPNIDVKSGASVNLTGGGDLYANEFFAGSGGTINVLDPTKAPANTFAIIPGISGFAPYDPQAAGQYVQTSSKTTLQSGESVYLAGGNGIAAGYYTLLPASYALLPGAFRVTAVAGYADLLPAQGATTLSDGSQIMAGKFAFVGTNILDARYSGFQVTPGSVVRTQSQFNDSYANSFFATQAAANGTQTPSSPVDAGQLIISAVGSGASLSLNGTFNAAPGTGGRGSLVDLNGPGFDIVNTVDPTNNNGLVQLTASSLNNLGAASLLIGGVRTQTVSGMNINVSAGNVVVGEVDANGVAVAGSAGSVLTGPEIILAANNAVTVKAGSDVEGKGTFSGPASNITIVNTNASGVSVNGDGALLRVSSAAQVSVARTNLATVPLSAKMTVENGATVGAQNAVLLDSSNATTVGNNAVLKGQDLSFAANSIDVGTNPNPAANSLALSGALLTQALTFNNLTLHSYNYINFYGSGSLGGLNAKQQHILSNLVLNSYGLDGFNTAGLTNIDAANVTLTNTNINPSTTAAPAYSAGNLMINADQITLASGNNLIQGFDTVTLAAAKQIVAQGTGSVSLNAGDANVHSLVLQAGQITGADASKLTITASNDIVSILPVAGVTASATEALNANLTIVGKSIADNGIIDLPSGSVMLHATGAAATDGVTLGGSSYTAANGMSKTVSGQTMYAQAGSVSLTADNGGVNIQSGAVVAVNGTATGGDAGSMNITATNGAVAIAGDLQGSANTKNAQGSFTLDAHSLTLNSISLSGNVFTDLNDTLTMGGFSTLRDMRIRSGNLVLAADVPGTVRAKAQTFNLTADAGTIDVYGTIYSFGTSAGNILLAANGNLTLHNGAMLDAHSTGAGSKGGSVTLETTVGAIDLANQLIDVHGSGNTGGSVLLRVPQINAYTDVALYNTGGSTLNVSNNANVTVEAFRVYAAPATLTAANVATTTTYFTDANNFANNYAAAIKARLGMNTTGMSNMHLTPGVELDSTGDIKLASNWDLGNWRFNDGTGDGLTEAGILTIRAGGNLTFGSGTTTASLTDGFAAPPSNNVITDQTAPITRNTDQFGAAQADWSYRLVAGADFSSANVKAVIKSTTSGNVVLVPGSETAIGTTSGYSGTPTFKIEQIRTGNGFIDIAAGGNLTLGNRDAVIYTAGLAADGNPVSGPSYFGANSGDLNILVKGNINGAVSNQLVTDWQWRFGDAFVNNQPVTNSPAYWYINIGSFRQGVGALGGGNASVTAGGDINSLSVSTPTAGYVDNWTNPANAPVTNVLGGGNLSVTAAGNINSGVFYVGNGQGTITVGGNLGVGILNNKPLYETVLALDYGNFDVRTGGDLMLKTVFNPTALAQGFSQNLGSVPYTDFFTYGDSSGVSLSSMSGNVTLAGMSTGNFWKSTTSTPVGFFYLNTSTNPAISAASVYPGSLQVSALDGNITGNGFTMFPSAQGELKLVAAQNIQLNGQLLMSGAAPSTLQPTTASDTYSNSALQNGQGLLHASDVQQVILSAGANISGKSDMSSSIVVPKAAQIDAGQDVQYLSFTVQNLNPQDTTSIISGRDISTIQASVAGPGQVVLQAGRNVDFGQYNGIMTTGNLTNPLLPQQGSSVTVVAGVGQGATDNSAFINKYINPADSSTYNADLISYVNQYDTVQQGETAAQAFKSFSALSQPLQDAFVRQVFFSELKQSGISAVNSGNYQPGYDAISKMFPNGGYKGDISLYYSQIKTERGGNINLFAPGGGVNAGLANPPASGQQKSASQLGIVTVTGGNINAFVNNDFTVNQSRVFTLQGGDILMWSSYGNIDAGKGSKTVSSTPPPLLVVDPKTGTFNLDVTQSVVGSGIRVLLANKNVVPGNVELIAPSGTVNAGDAGIGSAGNVTIAALHVVGADNINFGGVSAGVPVSVPAPVSVGLGNLQDASKAADQATQSISNTNDMASMKDFKPTFLSVEVIGLGDSPNP
jgi:filamentous hemagglutinin family protein